MNSIVELLKQQVSAIVLDGDSSFVQEKSDALSMFYPFLLSMLKGQPSLISSLSGHLNPRLGDLFESNAALKNQFLDHVRGIVPVFEIESALSKSILPVLGVLENQAGSSEPDVIAHLLNTQQDEIQSALPAWAASILSGLGIGTAAAPTIHQAPATASDRKSSPWPAMIAIIILGLLAAFWFKSCSNQKKVEESLPPMQSAAAQPASLQLSTNEKGALVSCQISVNNSSYIDILQQQVKQIFSHPLGCGAAADASYHTEYIDQDAIPSVLKLVLGTPNVSLNWVGDQLSIQSAHPQDAERLAGQIKNLAKHMNIMVQKPVDESAAVSNSLSDAQKALAAINPGHIRALDVATALNLQIINFASGSSAIPDANKSILDQAAALMQRARHVELSVTGHTDATGNAEANKTLSQSRAQAVVDYLISKGVDPAQLQAIGMGQEKPIADNSTQEGQFKNRRIEFEVLNIDTGVVREVGEEGVKEKP